MEGAHLRGTANIMKSKHSGSLMEWELVNERITGARFFSKHNVIQLTVVQCCTLTNEAGKEEKEAQQTECFP